MCTIYIYSLLSVKPFELFQLREIIHPNTEVGNYLRYGLTLREILRGIFDYWMPRFIAIFFDRLIS